DTLDAARSELDASGLSMTYEGPTTNSTVSSYSPTGAVKKGTTVHVVLKSVSGSSSSGTSGSGSDN
ncbi:MAG: hypothetical protein ACI364_05690, partial [Coriobacteriales bacterium]